MDSQLSLCNALVLPNFSSKSLDSDWVVFDLNRPASRKDLNFPASQASANLSWLEGSA